MDLDLDQIAPISLSWDEYDWFISLRLLHYFSKSTKSTKKIKNTLSCNAMRIFQRLLVPHITFMSSCLTHVPKVPQSFGNHTTASWIELSDLHWIFFEGSRSENPRFCWVCDKKIFVNPHQSSDLAGQKWKSIKRGQQLTGNIFFAAIDLTVEQTVTEHTVQ